MFSLLRNGLLYTDISPDIVEHDEDMDGDLWNYDGIDVYRGMFDPKYVSHGLQVYWLYDDNSKRIGLAEHEMDIPEVYKALWFRDTPFGTILQEDGWKSKNVTLWSLLSNEAYQDCLESDFKYVSDWALQSGKLLITPSMLLNRPSLYTCSSCGKKSLSEISGCKSVEKTVLDFNQFSILFLDDLFVIHEAPENSRVLQQSYVYCEGQQQGQEQEPEQTRPPSLQPQEPEQPHTENLEHESPPE
jgi:hypothetical protein